MINMSTIDKKKHLEELVYKGANNKKLEMSDLVFDRIGNELSIIEKKGFEDFFILHSRIIEICNDLKLLRTYGRRSAAGSFVNYCLDITKVNPIEENLVFDRFINDKQVFTPVIEIDIPSGFQEIITDKLKVKYPEYKSYFIAFINDTDSYEKIIYENIEYKKHPCGIIITHDDLTDCVFDYQGRKFYHFSGNRSDEYFRNKVNLLELPYLNKLQMIVDEIGDKYHPYNIPIDDKDVFKFLSSGDLKNIFQCDSSYMERILSEFKPSSIRDLTIMNALFRPPTVSIIDKMIENKFDVSQRVKFEDSRITDLLQETYGLLIYQETFLHLAKELAGMSFSEALESLHKIFNDDTHKELVSFTSTFTNLCLQRGNLYSLDSPKLLVLFLESLPLLFPKSHSICYATVAYWGAYYKTHFRKEFDKAFQLHK